jgi:RHS repeat-associated protein
LTCRQELAEQAMTALTSSTGANKQPVRNRQWIGRTRRPCDRHRERSYPATVVHRYYDPATEQFLSVDPLVDQTGTPYAFIAGDPVNDIDPSGLGLIPGLGVLGDVLNAAKKVARAVVDVAAVVPYGVYYGSYETARGINAVGSNFGIVGSAFSHIATAPLAVPEALGLGGDVAIDAFKGWAFGGESIFDEGKRGYLNPLHSFLPGPLKGPQVHLPGLYRDECGQVRVDIEW